MGRYTTFIEGSAINLCVPNRNALDDGWADWFNNTNVTTYLEQGCFPNLREQQEEFFQSLVNNERFALIITPKDEDKAVGIISLSELNYRKRSCQVAMLIGDPTTKSKEMLFGLEAMARVAEHAFLKLGMDRIWAGQSFPGLAKWNKHLEQIGYRSEGVLENAFVKGRIVTDMVMISCQFSTYEMIKKKRKGYFWPGTEKMQELIRTMPKNGFAESLRETISSEKAEYFSKLKYF